MKSLKIFLIFAILFQLNSARRNQRRKENSVDRDGKLLSLFSVVTFENAACTASNGRIGSCYPASECSRRGGSSSGSCAAGFGVCCVITLASGTITQNCTYFQSNNFPSALADAGTYRIAVNKCSCDVCSLRLDFETFNTLGPASTTEAAGTQTCQDQFRVSTSSVTNYPIICGLNTGMHIYLDMGEDCTDTANLQFDISSTAFSQRSWDIKVSQVKCNDQLNPPSSCFQYYTETSGQIKTFNFDNAAQTHLENQQYSICVRQAEGFCCIQYTACSDANSFSLDQASAAFDVGNNDETCTTDYVIISGASSTCSSNPGSSMVSRICGSAFTTVKGKNAPNIALCDCSQPFDIGIKTDATADAASAAKISRGVCLDYKQLPCNSV